VERLWQTCTTLREHRGDGHIAAWVANGRTAAEVAVLFVADTGIPDDVLVSNRGWTDTDWSTATASLERKGLLRGGSPTAEGSALRSEVETRTDLLAFERFSGTTPEDRQNLLAALGPVANEIAMSGIIPFPNPMGLPRAP
jgi:hypothetical protein